MHLPPDLLTRRHFLGRAGLGAIALRALLADEERLPHFAPRAKNVIWLFMAGAPSQLDLFEPKPVLQRHHGQPVPAEYLAGQRFAFLKGTPNLLGSPFRFAPRGQCGAQVSELLPHHATIVDQVAWVRSLHTDHFNHGPAQIFMNTGHTQIGRPSCGAWVSYGLGSAARDLPGFVVLVSGKIDPGAGSACWSSGFLPTHHQGVELRSKGEPVPCVQNPTGVDAEARRRTIDLVTDLDRERLASTRRPRHRGPHRRLRTRVPDAEQRARAGRSRTGTGGRARALRHRTRPQQLRQQLPDGAAAGRTRHALRAALPPRLGPPRHRPRRRSVARVAEHVPPNRPRRDLR